jgi:stage II sporulation protein AA (anti-sigma F factor antagonist)
VDAYLTTGDDDHVTITVRGEVDLSNTEGLLQRLIVLAHPATGHIMLDMSQVTFMDCAGLRMLIMIDRHARARGGSVHVATASPALARLFELVGPLAAPVFAPPTPSDRHHPHHGIRPRHPDPPMRPSPTPRPEPEQPAADCARPLPPSPPASGADEHVSPGPAALALAEPAARRGASWRPWRRPSRSHKAA